LFTKDFKKFRVALGAIAAAVLLYAGINAGLLSLSQWVERTSDVYPYQDEDWLRYLLPGLFENRGHNRIMLIGESAVREGLLAKEFERAFPKMRTFHAEMGGATFDDMLISLEYIERVYGRTALPRVLVLGISLRFVANLPEKRPFRPVLERYSPYYSIEETQSGPRLRPKKIWHRWLSWLRFVLFKQQKRYLASLSALSRAFVSMDSIESLGQVFHAGRAESNRRWGSPYMFHHLPTVGLDDFLDPGRPFWKIYSWEPETSCHMISDHFKKLRDFTEKKEIRLYVFNLPEHVEIRDRYDKDRYQRYLALVRQNLGNTPYLDLREMLRPDEFYDAVHANLPGAKRLTERVIRFIKDHRDGAPELAG
jgi:hypothetical protein